MLAFRIRYVAFDEFCFHLQLVQKNVAKGESSEQPAKPKDNQPQNGSSNHNNSNASAANTPAKSSKTIVYDMPEKKSTKKSATTSASSTRQSQKESQKEPQKEQPEKSVKTTKKEKAKQVVDLSLSNILNDV